MPTIRITKLKFLLLGNVDERGSRIPDHKVAGATGMPQATLTRLAYGQRPIQVDHLLPLAEYFCVDPVHIQGWVEVSLTDEGWTVTDAEVPVS